MEPKWEKLNDLSITIMDSLKVDNKINLINNFMDMDDEASLEAVKLKGIDYQYLEDGR